MNSLSCIAAGSSTGAAPLRLVPASQSGASARPARQTDTAELSTQAVEYSRHIKEQPMRNDLIQSVRREIEHGVIDSDERLDAALDRMIDSLTAR